MTTSTLTPITTAVKTVGHFTLNADGTIEGPAAYFREQGNAYLKRLLAGENEAFNMSAHLSPDIETAILVFLQTDCAAWIGAKQLHAALR
ncbi:MAG: hypothetical protein JWP44_4517 [Mucilaginibacter sp.]|nr:hypothetical protein [Mucilaginibacter sp.]